jgi:DNA-binding NarL/FixJ family response regulator
VHGPGDNDDRRGTVLIVDDHPLVADALRETLEYRMLDVAVVEDVSLEGVLVAAERTHASLAVVDIDLGEGRNGVDLIEPLTARGVRVLVLSGLRDAATLGRSLRAGAVAMLAKTESPAAIGRAIEDALAGRLAMRSTQRDWLLERADTVERRQTQRLAPFNELTPGEAGVLEALTDGLNAAEIAQARAVSLTTVRTHIRSILRKLDVNSQLAAVALARQAHWSGPPHQH